MTQPLKLGISACLLGENVRYDGGHKLDRFIAYTLGKYVEFVPVCPEVECGLGVPREPLRLIGDPEKPRLVATRTGRDLTDLMLQWAEFRLAELEKEDLCGFIFKSKSPSSGMERVKLYNDKGIPSANGVGIFAGAFMRHFPLLPVEDEGRLHDPVLRENFIERIFVFKRWRALVGQDSSRRGLVDFHARHKLLILSHSPAKLREMGRLVARAGDLYVQTLFDEYQGCLMTALRLKSTPRKNTNVLQHMMGFFKRHLSADEKQEMLEVIDRYRLELVPLIVPLTLFNHYVRKYDPPYLRDQYYLDPHPLELKLRNHV
jgi:uncharacterized protein YbgA (DUF1722 family)/uncharacterized protein YbbK (DUF523 family)